MSIHTESITDQCYDLIWKKILNKEYLPGEQIPTKQIAEDNGLSVMPVRLALRELTNNGIVLNKARVGFFVRDFTNQEMLDISRTRRMYEIYGLENYFSYLNLDRLREIYDVIYENEGDKFSNIKYQESDLALHSEFVLGIPNAFLKREYIRLKPLFAMVMIRDSSMEDILVSREEHLDILRNIFSNDQEGTIRALAKHLDRVELSIS